MNQNEQLSFLSDDERMKVYRELVAGTQHFWSKGKMQVDKVIPVLQTLTRVAKSDPIFMAHLNSWSIKKSDSKDLKVLTTFANALSDADGTPFFVGSELNKPNLRTVSQAALQELDPKLVYRIIELSRMKLALANSASSAHLPRSLRTAVKKYIKIREGNSAAMKSSGFAETFKDIYRAANIKPAEAAYTALKWKQGNKEKGVIKPEKVMLYNFEGMTDLEVAQEIQNKKIPALTAVSLIDRKMSPVIAVAVLEQASGDQALILKKLWDSQGLLKDKEVVKLFQSKIKTAKSLDRVEKINTLIDKEVEAILKEAKSEKQKEIAGDLGSIFLHLDTSGSMERVIDFAKNCSSIFAECISNPEKNFHWAAYNQNSVELPKLTKFAKQDFHQALYGRKAFGGTNCFINYVKARDLGCMYDVHFSDEECNRSLDQYIQASGGKKPLGCVVVNFSNNIVRRIQQEYEKHGIPVVVLKPEMLTESANIAQTIKAALKGADVQLQEIMSTPLLKLPEWWYSISVK